MLDEWEMHDARISRLQNDAKLYKGMASDAYAQMNGSKSVCKGLVSVLREAIDLFNECGGCPQYWYYRAEYVIIRAEEFWAERMEDDTPREYLSSPQ